MKEPITILIADRNRHVRKFLRRELRAEGYQVRLAKSGREIMKCISDQEPLDLLLIDLDLPDAGEIDILEKLQNRIPVLPVVVHTYLSEYINRSFFLSSAILVEKEGSNIERLKKVVSEILRRSYPGRLGQGRVNERQAE